MPRHGSLFQAVGAAMLLALAAPAAAAAHSTRYVTPTATATSGACSAALPCKVGYAINEASEGDEVVVASGVYSVKVELEAKDLDVHGVAGQAPPLLIGDASVGDTLLTVDGGTLRHLSLRGTATDQDTLELKDGLAEDLEIVSAAGDGAKVQTSDATTILRDSVVVTEATGSGPAALKLREGGGGGGALAVRNVTAIAPGANAIRCEVAAPQQATLANLIARGGEADVDATNGGSGCSATYSNLRPERSPALWLGTGILSDEPLYADPAAGDYRPQPDSPTVDAGIADAQTSAVDPDGRARTVPDVGAFECCGEDPWPGPTAMVPPSGARERPGSGDAADPRDPGARARPDGHRRARTGQGARPPARHQALPQAQRRDAAAERHRGRRPPRPHQPHHRPRRGGAVPDRPLLGLALRDPAGQRRAGHDVADAARRRLRPLSGPRERRAARDRQRRRAREPDDAARRAQPVGARSRRALPHLRQQQRRHGPRHRLGHARPLRRHGHARARGRRRGQGPAHGQDRRRARRPRIPREAMRSGPAFHGCGCC